MSIAFSFTDSITSWETDYHSPHVEKPVEMQQEVVELMSGDAFFSVHVTELGDPVIPNIVQFSWEDAPRPLLPIVDAAYRAGDLVTVGYPWRDEMEYITGYITEYSEVPAARRTIGLSFTVRDVSLEGS